MAMTSVPRLARTLSRSHASRGRSRAIAHPLHSRRWTAAVPNVMGHSPPSHLAFRYNRLQSPLWRASATPLLSVIGYESGPSNILPAAMRRSISVQVLPAFLDERVFTSPVLPLNPSDDVSMGCVASLFWPIFSPVSPPVSL
jgi:hypothetical protein